MRSYLFAVVALLFCASFSLSNKVSSNSKLVQCWKGSSNRKTVRDFTVHRLSGDRVCISWHTEGESQQVAYEVLRKHKVLSQFVSLGVVKPKYQDTKTADYSFVDFNDYADSSYYCLKKTTTDDVVFYSLTRGVEGVTRER